MGHEEHEILARASLRVAVITFTDTRDHNTDKSGSIIIDLLKKSGHQMVDYRIIKENPDEMKAGFAELLAQDQIQAIICNGGTGLSRRDNTIEIARPLFDKEIEGFGDIFRLVSYQQIGAAAMLSRATAGINSGRVIVCLPGSSAAVRLAMTRIVLPQLAHMHWEANR